MGFLDNLLAPFNTDAQDKASSDLIAAYQNAYGQATPLFQQGRTALTTAGNTATGAYAPFLGAGQSAVGQLANATGANGPSGTASALSNFTGGPSYQFNLDQMTQNLLRSQEATGQANSGATNNDILQLTSGYAGNQWQNYISNLAQLAGLGTNAASGTANAALTTGAGLNNSFTNQGSAAYGTQVGEGNAQAQADLAPLTAGKNLWGLGTNLLQMGAGMPVSGGFLGSSGGYGQGGGNNNSSPGWQNSVLGGMFNTLKPYLQGNSQGSTPGYAEGGRPDPGQPAVVGENGPEIFVPDRPGTVVPNDAISDASGLDIGELAKRYSQYQRPQWTGKDWAAAGAAAVDPAGIPSYLAGKVAPEFGQAWRDTEAASPEGELAGSIVSPTGILAGPARYLGMASRLAKAYPGGAAAVTGATAAGLLGAGTSSAGDVKVAGAMPDEQAQIDAMDAKVQNLTDQKNKAMTDKKIVNAPLSVKTATAKTYDDQIANIQLDRRTLLGNISDRTAQGAPFATRHPDWNTALSALPAASPLTGALVGLAAGKKISPMKRLATYGAGIGGGALEGALGAGLPEVIDAKMPRGMPARAEAQQNFTDPMFYGAGGAETLFGAGAGALGAKLGMLRFGQGAAKARPRTTRAAASAAAPAAAPSRSAGAGPQFAPFQ